MKLASRHFWLHRQQTAAYNSRSAGFRASCDSGRNGMRSLVWLAIVSCLTVPAWAAPPSEAEMAARIDALLGELWTRERVQPTAPAEDAEFLRRAWLDLCGTIPPLNDPDTLCGIRGFLESTAPDKRVRLIERLLAKPSHATHFANVWKNVLLPPDADIQRQL